MKILKTVLNGLQRAVTPTGDGTSLIKDLIALKVSTEDPEIDDEVARLIGLGTRVLGVVVILAIAHYTSMTPEEVMELSKQVSEIIQAIGGN